MVRQVSATDAAQPLQLERRHNRRCINLLHRTASGERLCCRNPAGLPHGDALGHSAHRSERHRIGRNQAPCKEQVSGPARDHGAQGDGVVVAACHGRVVGHLRCGSHHIVDRVVAGNNAITKTLRLGQVVRRQPVQGFKLSRLPHTHRGSYAPHLRPLEPRNAVDQEPRHLRAAPAPLLRGKRHRIRIGAVNASDGDRIAKDAAGVKTPHQIELDQVGVQSTLGDAPRRMAAKVRITVRKNTITISPDHVK